MMLCLLHWRRTAASGLLAFLLAWSAALAAAEPEFLPPDQAFRFSHTTTASGERLLNWDIAPGYYLYQQRLKITVGGQPLAGVVWLSEPEEKDDPNFGRVNIFHQQLQLRIPAVAEETLVSYQGLCRGWAVLSADQTADSGQCGGVAAGSDYGNSGCRAGGAGRSNPG